MVNVGGRSKGCSTCRRRKVKCDENRPICNRCKRCGLECTGPRGLSLVAGTIVKSRRTTRPTGNERPAEPEANANANTSEDHTGNSLFSTAQHSVSLSASLPPNKFDIFMSYTSRKYLTPNGPLDLAIREMKIADLTSATTSRGNDKDLFFAQAILCFATLIFGAQHRQAPIMNHGYHIRGMALKNLNQALSEPQCFRRDDVFQCVCLLAVLECVVPTSPKSYLQHMLGLERLLELRNPSESCSPKMGLLYKHMRHMMIFASLLSGRPSILARPGWKIMMRSVCSENEEPTQDLFDVLADVTVLNAERNDVLNTRTMDAEQASQKRDNILERARTLLHQLRNWITIWETNSRNARAETSAPLDKFQLLNGALDGEAPPFTTGFEFSNDFSATMLMFYNTTLIYILQILSSLSSTPTTSARPSLSSEYQIHIPNLVQEGSSEARPGKDRKEDLEDMERAAAFEIFRCVPHFLGTNNERQGAPTSNPITQWAITTAMRTLGGHESSEARWMLALLNKTGLVAPALVAPALWVR